MQLTKHFTLAEFIASDTAARRGIDNAPPAELLPVLERTANCMETVRQVLGKSPVIITSAYRCPALNRAVGSGAKSAHITGHAVDFKAPAFGTPLQVAKAIKAAKLNYDQLIHEFGGWVHISFDPRMRGEVLTIYSEGGKARTVAGLRAIK